MGCDYARAGVFPVVGVVLMSAPQKRERISICEGGNALTRATCVAQITCQASPSLIPRCDAGLRNPESVFFSLLACWGIIIHSRRASIQVTVIVIIWCQRFGTCGNKWPYIPTMSCLPGGSGRLPLLPKLAAYLWLFAWAKCV